MTSQSTIYTRRDIREIMAKLQQNMTNGSCWLIVPTAIVRSKGWSKGDEFVISDEPNGVKFLRGERRL